MSKRSNSEISSAEEPHMKHLHPITGDASESTTLKRSAPNDLEDERPLKQSEQTHGTVHATVYTVEPAWKHVIYMINKKQYGDVTRFFQSNSIEMVMKQLPEKYTTNVEYMIRFVLCCYDSHNFMQPSMKAKITRVLFTIINENPSKLQKFEQRMQNNIITSIIKVTIRNINMLYGMCDRLCAYVVRISSTHSLDQYDPNIDFSKIGPFTWLELLTKQRYATYRHQIQSLGYQFLETFVDKLIELSVKDRRYIYSITNLFVIVSSYADREHYLGIMNKLAGSHWMDLKNVRIHEYQHVRALAVVVMLNVFNSRSSNKKELESYLVMNVVERLPLWLIPKDYFPRKSRLENATQHDIAEYIQHKSNDSAKMRHLFTSERVWTVAELNSFDSHLFVKYFSGMRLRKNSNINDFTSVSFTPKLIKEICKKNPFLYHKMNDEMKQTPGLFMQILPEEFGMMPESIRENETYCRYVAKVGINYSFMSFEMQLLVVDDILENVPTKFGYSKPEMFQLKEQVMNATVKYVSNITCSPFHSDPKFVYETLRRKQQVDDVSEHYFKCITSKLKFPPRNILKISYELRLDLTKKSKIHKRFLVPSVNNPELMVPDYDFIMNAEKRVFTFVMLIKQNYTRIYGELTNVFGSVKLMEYLD